MWRRPPPGLCQNEPVVFFFSLISPPPSVLPRLRCLVSPTSHPRSHDDFVERPAVPFVSKPVTCVRQVSLFSSYELFGRLRAIQNPSHGCDPFPPSDVMSRSDPLSVMNFCYFLLPPFTLGEAILRDTHRLPPFLPVLFLPRFQPP